EAAMELGRLDVTIEHFEDSVAFLRLELGDASSEAAVDEQGLGATDRMSTHNWMLMTGKFHVAAPTRLGSMRVRLAAVVNRGHSGDHRLDWLRQRFISLVHVGEASVATDLRQFVHVQDRSHRRLLVA